MSDFTNWLTKYDMNITPPSELLKDAVDVWLDIPLVPVHLATMLASSAAVGATRFENGPGTLASVVTGLTSYANTLFNNKLVDVLNTLAQYTADCNIDGIPIRTSKMSCDRQVQVSESSVISQATMSRNNVIVNATPKGRVITLNGYLLPVSAIDSYLITKPTLYFQIDYLDAMATSRRPVWFKDKANRFYQMQITNFHYDDVPEATAAVPITITMQEYITIDTNAVTLGKIGKKISARQVNI